MLARLGSSLKTRIAVVVGLLSFAGIAVISLLVTRIQHEDMQALLTKQQLTTSTYIASDVNGKLQLRLDSLKRVALNIPEALFRNPAKMQTWLQDRRAIHTLFPTGLLVIPPNGGPPIADYPRMENRPKSFVDRDWFIGAIETRQAYISKPLVARATSQPALVMAIPLYDQSGTLLGILAGVTPLEAAGFLDLVFGKQQEGSTRHQLISIRHNLLIFNAGGHARISELPPAGVDAAFDHARNGMHGIRTLPQAGGDNELVSIVNIPLADWSLISRQPAQQAFSPLDNTQRNALLMTLLLGIPLIVGLLAALHHLLQPFAELARQLHDMAVGERPMMPLATHATDEVADVVDSFNRLQARLQRQEARLADMAHRDPLTGLPNRLSMSTQLEGELLRVRRSHRGLALLFLDLDEFKPVNDEHGHQTGDCLLVDIAERLVSCVREIDIVARLGGDEFLILLTDSDAPREAGERVARCCIEALARPFLIDNKTIHIGVSVGLATTLGGAENPPGAHTLIAHADQAMYAAKAAGRNQCVIYNADTTLMKAKHV